MSMLPYIDQEERESQVLRASVVEAAMTLGPKVTGWMFDNAVAEEEEEDEEEQLHTPDLVSSTSSDDSHSITFSSQDGHGGLSPRTRLPKDAGGQLISLPSKLTPKMEQGYYLKSPFVVIDEGHFPRYAPEYPYVPPINTDIQRHPGLTSSSSTSSLSAQSASTKKSGKGFMFSKKSPASRPLSPQSSITASVSTSSASTPSRPTPSLDDPVPRAGTPSSSGRTSPSARSSPGKLTKKQRIPPGRTPDWDFKDPDRPSFFALNDAPALDIKAKKKAKKAPLEDGYVSEGTGKRKKDEKDKDKEKRPVMKRSMTSRLMSKWSTADLRTPAPPPVPALPVPIHDRFASKSVTAVREETSMAEDEAAQTQLSAEWRARARSPYLDVPRTEPSPASSASSFALVPDLNIVTRRKLEVEAPSPGTRHGHVIGSDNDAKLAMLAKLITEPVAPVPAIAVQPPPRESVQEVDAPSTSFVVPSPTFERSPRPPSHVLRYYDVPLSPKPPNRAPAFVHGHASAQLRADSALAASYEPLRGGSAPPSVMGQQPQVRGRQAPFPTKPILLTAQSRHPALANNPRLLATPHRYRDVQNLPVDVPRSVRSSFEKDQEREERLDRDDRSVYSRASFMDVGKSVDARDRLVRGVDALVEAGETVRGPGWF